uniref:Uncharacterized protein n=1 Tax=Anopheles atroparvus TaxID=41427 RepID=A0A182JKX9_ANOAO
MLILLPFASVDDPAESQVITSHVCLARGSSWRTYLIDGPFRSPNSLRSFFIRLVYNFLFSSRSVWLSLTSVEWISVASISSVVVNNSLQGEETSGATSHVEGFTFSCFTSAVLLKLNSFTRNTSIAARATMSSQFESSGELQFLEIEPGDAQRPLLEVLQYAHDDRLLIQLGDQIGLVLRIADHVQQPLRLLRRQQIVDEHTLLAQFFRILQATLENPLLRGEKLGQNDKQWNIFLHRSCGPGMLT